MKWIAPVLSVYVLASCAATSGGDIRIEAACTAQRYLGLNGYLTAEVTDTSSIDLEMWDAVNFSKDGAIDWEQLLAARRGKFTNRLHGVSVGSNGQFLVTYKTEKSLACVEVSRDLRSAHLAEAPCLLTRDLRRVTEQSLTCREPVHADSGRQG